MFKKIILLSLIISLGTIGFCTEDIGNKIIEDEYPKADAVLPNKSDTETFIIEGSVEKNIDMTLERCWS